MKTTSILTYATAASLTLFLVSLLVTQDVWTSSEMFAAALATLIALHDYAPRRYFAITSPPRRITAARLQVSRFQEPLGAPRRKSTRQHISVTA